MTKNSHKLPKTLWGGFSMGRLDLDPYASCAGWYGTLYTSKREALKHYEDVRQVEIREVEK